MNLEQKWLEDFVALALTRSFSQAAERRFVTQPAFSRRIRSLEQALGLTLVDRSCTPVELTEAGRLFLITARSVVEQLGDAMRQLHNLADSQGEMLQFAVAHSLALSYFPGWLASLRAQGEPLRSRMVATNVGEAMLALREGRCDLMLAYHDPEATLQLDPQLFPALSLGSSEMLPVCAADEHGQPLFSLTSAEPVPLLAYSSGAFLGRSLGLLLRERNLRYVTQYETAMAEGLKGMALEGLGVAWLPRLTMRRELASGELVICGDARWAIALEIRLYRCALRHKPFITRFWQRLEKLQAR
ncbi:LysR substrate-binding domain-containing protein [Atopomonas sediminilitoris]|uniref:LysR substrate-binding domain-containing protein n=1 Tax=Atopomonas sediminilitoris TaxID=2919919 RepID=UPI001F4E445F|nr:LysR substrate-binding domain-containing protein [Atopomonas sediminilitoris]MCJ8168171.1 LysR substrate-binding domain-containing protein [Atopomonas sediminilitoris]